MAQGLVMGFLAFHTQLIYLSTGRSAGQWVVTHWLSSSGLWKNEWATFTQWTPVYLKVLCQKGRVTAEKKKHNYTRVEPKFLYEHKKCDTSESCWQEDSRKPAPSSSALLGRDVFYWSHTKSVFCYTCSVLFVGNRFERTRNSHPLQKPPTLWNKTLRDQWSPILCLRNTYCFILNTVIKPENHKLHIYTHSHKNSWTWS